MEKSSPHRFRHYRKFLVTTTNPDHLSYTYLPEGCESDPLTTKRLSAYIERAKKLDAEFPAVVAAREQKLKEEQDRRQALNAIQNARRKAERDLLNAALGDSLDALIAARAAYRAAVKAHIEQQSRPTKTAKGA